MAYGFLSGQRSGVQSVEGTFPDIDGDVKLERWNLNENHPIGSWWVSDDPTSPAALFGGTWERMEGKFLLAADSSHPAGSTGGAFAIIQTEAQMPKHSHTPSKNGSTWVPAGDVSRRKVPDAGQGNGYYVPATDTMNGWVWGNTGLQGGNQPMDITNPYYATYMWRRIA